ncbi:Transposon Ty3-I Gag-Pol polyprotein [Labeo rohita]|uniref:Gypsy retrotransposon integrase-like protein 1 n=1 Tax=Labeo rohita TaxID=84645 RepID=A0ABQ8L8W7_LABRO|nr:Transposon Ty3-I Gag-Pol polyprotein [Labeo rohita]
MHVDPSSQDLLTIVTHKGMYKYQRLPFGITSALAQFQRAMDRILSGLAGVQCYLDNLLITGKDDQEHLSNLEATLQRLQSFGLKVRKDKCEFFCPAVEYLGHVIDGSRLRKAPSKVKAILEAPAPQNVSQLWSFLGLLTYYAKFVPNLATRLKPWQDLLNKYKKWDWTKQCEESFIEVKTALAHSEALTNFNPALPVQLACDASPYGVGAVVSHIMPSGEEKPIAFASRTLSKAECNYAQIEREALAIVFGVKKFHQFMFGRQFTLLTDHRPLTSIFGPHSGIPSLAAARMQRWALLLSAHQYDIKYRRSEHHANADGLSRLPLPTTHPEPAKAEIFYFKEVDNSPVTAAQVKKHTRTDPVMSKVLDLVFRGEVGEMSPLLRPYMSRRSELTVESGCLLWGSRVIIPPPLRQRVLEELHSGHCGVVRMKEIARSYLWWPGMDSEIEEKAKSCSACQKLKNTPQPAPLHPWQWPEEPWVRVHIDFAGPLEDHMFLVLLDAHSKWPEVEIMKSTSSVNTVEALRLIFGRFGLPQPLVSDNGPQLVSEEFEAFMKANGIHHIRSAPYHPSTNGLAERFKHSHATTKVSPATAMFKRQLRTRLDLLKPQKTKQTVQAQQNIQRERCLKAKHRFFRPGDKVLARNYARGARWLPAVVIAQTGPVSYTVELAEGHLIWKRHVDQLLAANSCGNSEDPMTTDPYLEIAPDYHQLSEQFSAPTLENALTETSPSQVKETVSSTSSSNQTSAKENVTLSVPTARPYPQRERRPPNRLTL